MLIIWQALIKFIERLDKMVKIFSLTLLIATPMQAQHNFASYLDQIFFKAFTTPDPKIDKFVREFAPLLYLPPDETAGGWTMYPSGEIKTPVVITHSYIFEKHPFIEANFKYGEFKIYAPVSDPPDGRLPGLANMQVLLNFDKLVDAVKLFEKLRMNFKSIGKEDYYQQNEFWMFLQIYRRDDQSDTTSHASTIPIGCLIRLSKQRNIDAVYQLSISIS